MGTPGRPNAKGLFIQNAEDYPHIEQIYDLDKFHAVFLEHKDITEYRPAIELTGSWEEWCRLKIQWMDFGRLVEQWKDELEILLRSEAMAKLVSLLDASSPATAASIAKFLTQAGWNRRSGAGRPSKAEEKRMIADAASKAAETEADAKRIEDLLVIEGGMH